MGTALTLKSLRRFDLSLSSSSPESLTRSPPGFTPHPFTTGLSFALCRVSDLPLRLFLTPLPGLPEASLHTLCSVNDRGNFIRAMEFNYPFLELSEDARLTAQHLPEAPGGPSSEDECARRCSMPGFSCFLRSPSEMQLRPPTARLTSHPAGF